MCSTLKKILTKLLCFSLLIIGIGLLSLNFPGCASMRPPVEYYPVSQWIRWRPRPLPPLKILTATNGVIRVAIKPGSSQPSDISWGPFNIVEGTLTLKGRNWIITIEKNDKFTLDVHDTGVYTGVLRFANSSYVDLSITAKNVQDDTQAIQPRIGKITKIASVEGENPQPFELWKSDLRLYLHSTESNGWRCIEIPYFVSEDFQGDLGKLTLESNWYDWEAW